MLKGARLLLLGACLFVSGSHVRAVFHHPPLSFSHRPSLNCCTARCPSVRAAANYEEEPPVTEEPLLAAAPRVEAATVVATAAAVRTAEQEAEAEVADGVETAEPKFDWLCHWYPVNVLDTMDPTRPHAVQLLGINLVAWNDGKTVDGKKELGEWRVFDDACSHRLGPLSEGRVEADGDLLCSYHGWRFDSDGACSSLPYAERERAAKLCGSSRSRVGKYPTREADGLLWVFPFNGYEAEAVADAVPMPLIDELHDPRNRGRWKWKIPAGVRDFPCGWDAMVENTLDPAHFCAAHHGTLGNRYEDPQPYQMELSTEISLEDGFIVNGELGRIEFKPPCLVKYAPNYSAMPFGESLVIATYCVPTRPGWVRPLANVLLDKEATLGNTLAERALSIFMNFATPKWLGHILASIVLHQDAGLLYHQSRNMRERGYNFAVEQADDDVSDADAADDVLNGMPTRRSTPATGDDAPSGGVSVAYERIAFCPTSVDRAVLAYRQWLRTKGGAGIPWQCPDVLPPRGSEDLYDMYDAHTKHCSHCQGALRNLNAAKYASVGLVVASALWVPDGAERTAAVLGGCAVGAALQFVIGLFYRYEFSHADND